MTRISIKLRTQVITRARHTCEYCLVHADYVLFSHEVDHIIATKHGGRNELKNLAYACAQCNRFKGSDITSVDPKTDMVALLFNPRAHPWSEHFVLNGPVIDATTAMGHATERLLQFNQIDRILLRKELLADGRYPFQFGE